MKAMQFLSKALVNNYFHLFKFLMILGRLLYCKWMPDEVGAAHFSKLLVMEPRQRNEGVGTLYDSLNIFKNSCHNLFSISKYLIAFESSISSSSFVF